MKKSRGVPGRFRPLFAVALLGVILSGCAEPEIALEPDQLSRMIAREKTMQWVGYGFSGDVRLDPDGTARISVAAHGEDAGEWAQEGSSVCVKFERAIRRTRRCAEIARLPDGTYEVRDQQTKTRLGLLYSKTAR
ncbi:MAG: hypothetical protein H2045_06180 [Rhizobiales bacterium]|nr:hypothetical protein [Hyphomicrobiales bacterium]